VLPRLKDLLTAAALEDDPDIIAHACVLFGRLGDAAAASFIRGQLDSTHHIELYRDGKLETVEPGALARHALEICSGA
jgi:hypothetical protein